LRARLRQRPAERYSTRVDAPLVGDVDLAAVLADVPPEYSLKGMFFSRCVATLVGDVASAQAQMPSTGAREKMEMDCSWTDVAQGLVAPPLNGKYHAFESYPMVDYVRLFDRIARARFPGSTREAYRLLARGEAEVFAATTLGKVTFSMVRDPEVALVRYPELFGVLSTGPVVTAERAGPHRVVVSFQEHAGSIERLIGVLEGLTMAFDVTPSLDVVVDPTGRASFAVSW
jgi:uncharacterized protein (TIGR02265 family)